MSLIHQGVSDLLPTLVRVARLALPQLHGSAVAAVVLRRGIEAETPSLVHELVVVPDPLLVRTAPTGPHLNPGPVGGRGVCSRVQAQAMGLVHEFVVLYPELVDVPAPDTRPQLHGSAVAEVALRGGIKALAAGLVHELEADLDPLLVRAPRARPQLDPVPVRTDAAGRGVQAQSASLVHDLVANVNPVLVCTAPTRPELHGAPVVVVAFAAASRHRPWAWFTRSPPPGERGPIFHNGLRPGL